MVAAALRLVRGLPALGVAALAIAAVACAPDELREPSFVLDAASAADPGLPRFDTNSRPVQDPFAGSCATQTIVAEKMALDLVFMVDASGSMLDVTEGGVSKWAAVRSAFTSFARAPESTGVSAALHFFPLVQPGVPTTCQGDTQCGGFGPCVFVRACSGASNLRTCESDGDCGASGPCVPLGECAVSKALCGPIGGACSERSGDVCQALPGRCAARDVCTSDAYAARGSELLPLPAAAETLVRQLDAQVPDGATPTGPALAGAIHRARAVAMARPDRRAAVVLATDGFPTSCEPRGVSEIAGLVAAGAAAVPPVPTFVIGVFAPAEAAAAANNLSKLAQAGGTMRPFIVSTAGNVSRDFLTALNDIRAAALACEYKLPQAQRGQIDLDQLNVRLLTANNEYLTIGNVPSAEACHPSKGGWFYETDPGSGERTLIRACEATCNKLKTEPRGRVDLIVGCKTIPVD